MKFIRQNLLLLIMLAVFLALLVVSIILLRQKKAECDNVRDELNRNISAKADLLGRSPSRTPENIEQIRKNSEQEKELIDDALQKLRPSEPPPAPLDPIKFRQELVATLRQMYNGIAPSIKLPDKFKFGFESYEEGRLPTKPEITSLLLKQLKVENELMRLCISSGVFELISLGRPEVEGVPPLKGQHSPKTEPLICTGGKVDYVDSPDYLYSTMSFSMEILCDTDSLRNFMNGLGGSKYLFIPRLVFVENEKKEPLVSPNPPSTGATGAPERNPRPSTGPIVKPPREAAQQKPMVDLKKLPFAFGEERIKVSMLIDWLEFHSEKKAAAKTPARPGKHPKTNRHPKTEGVAP